ncbi:MAG: penicillin-binding protein 2 [Phycisphaeraceae bacterium]|nr:penicillin-binding protein 2 [Phycisphaeraceae bacterium]
MRPGSERADRVAVVVIGAVVLALAVMLGRVAQLQLRPGDDLSVYVSERMATRPVVGYRGELLDRRGRLLSTTRIGYRVFVDPTRFASPPDEAIVALAEATGAPAEEVGRRVVRAMAINRERAAALEAAREPAEERRGGVRGALAVVFGGRGGGGEAGPGKAPPREGGKEREEEEGEETDGEEAQTPRPLIRYVPVGGVLSDAQLDEVRRLGLAGVHVERRPVREYAGGEIAASIVGKVGFEHTGLLGAELAMEKELAARDGQARYARDAWGRPLWIERGQWEPAEHGRDRRLSIDVELQRIATEELERGVLDANAAGGRLVLADPATGEILAMVDLIRAMPDLAEFPWWPAKAEPGAPTPARYDPSAGVRYRTISADPGRDVHPALGRNRCVEDIYEPGSTFKAFVWAVVSEAGAAKYDEVINTEGGQWRTSYGRAIADVTRRPTMTWEDVLMNSSNIGMVKVTERVGHRQLRDGLTRFGFGRATGIGLSGEAAGIITSERQWTKFTHTSVAFGHEVAVTPVQMVRAFSVFARTGDLAGTLPQVRLTAPEPGDPAIALRQRVLSPEVAAHTRMVLRRMAEKVEQNMAKADPSESEWRYPMWGKSGTAEIPLGRAPAGKRRPPGSTGYYDNQYNSSFVAGAPYERPRLVVIVVIDDPGPETIRKRQHYGSWVAGPVARRVLERALIYMGEPAERAPTTGIAAAAN